MVMSLELDYPNPHKKGEIFFKLPVLRILGPGPCNASMSVLSAMLYQPLAPSNKDYWKMNEDIQKMLRYVYQTENPLTLVTQTSGNGGNEAMVTNLADPGETIVVAVAGVWGAKVADMGRRYNLKVIELRVEDGEVYTFKELEEQIIKHKPVALFITQGDTSGGTLQPLEGLGDICHKHNCLLAVDAVVTIGAVPLFVDRWKIDAVCGGSQKGLGAPAGMSLLSFSPLAQFFILKKMLEKKHPPPYIFDILSLADVWNCFGKPIKYHYTYGTPMLAAVRQALEEICEEGVENVWERTRLATDLFISKLDKLGMKHFVEKPENRLPGVVCAVLPEGVSWRIVLERLIEQHSIDISFGIGPTANKAVRIGFLAQNAKSTVVEFFAEALEEAINYCREYCRVNGVPDDESLLAL
ncbi:hypothetical protein NQ317_012168 [Molorchus minor]|uniref:Alanine--glyoxylate aminotransferase n=1 Tax=Molorchus minor TaxID=1323400 RepID=A0ABQ9K5U5_9CUCU|nr:hypothetical protein NQ317_012168 [Molorchus minor]